MKLWRGFLLTGLLGLMSQVQAEERDWFPYCTNGSNTGYGYGWDPNVVDSNGSHSCLVPPVGTYPPGPGTYPPGPGTYPPAPPYPYPPYPGYPSYPPQPPRGVNCLVRNLRGAEYQAFAYGYGQAAVNAACDHALRQCLNDSIIKLSCRVEQTWAQ